MERPVFILIFLVLPLFGGTNYFYQNQSKLQKNFIFWVQINTKNNIITYQNIAISQSMKKHKNTNYACDIKLDKKDFLALKKPTNLLDMQNAFYSLVLDKKDEIFDCLSFDEIKVSDNLTTNHQTTTAQTNLNIIPLRFSVEIDKNTLLIFK